MGRNLPALSVTRYQSADLFMQCLFVKCHICYISAQLSCVFTAVSDFFEMDGGTPMTNIYQRHEWSVQTASSGFIPTQSQLTLISVPLRMRPNGKKAVQ